MGLGGADQSRFEFNPALSVDKRRTTEHMSEVRLFGLSIEGL